MVATTSGVQSQLTWKGRDQGQVGSERPRRGQTDSYKTDPPSRVETVTEDLPEGRGGSGEDTDQDHLFGRSPKGSLLNFLLLESGTGAHTHLRSNLPQTRKGGPEDVGPETET